MRRAKGNESTLWRTLCHSVLPVGAAPASEDS